MLSRIAQAAASRAATLRAPVLARSLHATLPRFGPIDDLDKWAAAVKNVTERPSNEDLLQLYAFYKQATTGPVAGADVKKPGMFDIVAKAKYQAWQTLGSMAKEEAAQQYIKVCQGLGASLTAPPKAAGAAAAAPPPPSSPAVLVSNDGVVRTITLNRPEKRNALTMEMYRDIVAQFAAAAADPGVNILVLTGNGPYFSGGNDLTNFAEMATKGGGLEAMAEVGRGILHDYVKAWIDFPKPLVVALNGPAVGIAVTTLPLADVVLATHKATFHAPLAGLGQTPEGTSSATFAPLMGHHRAFEMLVLGKKITATEAAGRGLISEVIEEGAFAETVKQRVKALAALPPQAVRLSKGILRDKSRAALHAANEDECRLIKERWLSEECMKAVMGFLSKPKN